MLQCYLWSIKLSSKEIISVIASFQRFCTHAQRNSRWFHARKILKVDIWKGCHINFTATGRPLFKYSDYFSLLSKKIWSSFIHIRLNDHYDASNWNNCIGKACISKEDLENLVLWCSTECDSILRIFNDLFIRYKLILTVKWFFLSFTLLFPHHFSEN